MSILFVFLMFLVILALSYSRRRKERPSTAVQPQSWERLWAPRIARASGLEVPEGYSFPPCHTWLAREGRKNARVGLDSFATNSFGKIDRIEVIGLDRWVRQGQKLMTVTGVGPDAELHRARGARKLLEKHRVIGLFL